MQKWDFIRFNYLQDIGYKIFYIVVTQRRKKIFMHWRDVKKRKHFLPYFQKPMLYFLLIFFIIARHVNPKQLINVMDLRCHYILHTYFYHGNVYKILIYM